MEELRSPDLLASPLAIVPVVDQDEQDFLRSRGAPGSSARLTFLAGATYLVAGRPAVPSLLFAPLLRTCSSLLLERSAADDPGAQRAHMWPATGYTDMVSPITSSQTGGFPSAGLRYAPGNSSGAAG
jgi:hypothetical protein